MIQAVFIKSDCLWLVPTIVVRALATFSIWKRNETVMERKKAVLSLTFKCPPK